MFRFRELGWLRCAGVMAFLGEKRCLITKQPGKEFFGASKQPDSDWILLTFDSEVVLVQPYDSKVIRTWTCPQKKGSKLSSKAVFSYEDKEFVVVQNGMTLRTLEESNFQHSETFTMKHRVHAIIGFQGCSPIVMLQDGSIFALNHVLEDPKEIAPDPLLQMKVDKIVFCDGIANSDGGLTVYSICEIQNNYRILVSTLHPERNQAEHCHTSLFVDECRLEAAAASQHTESSYPVISTLWSDGSLRQIQVHSSVKGRIDLQIERITNLEIDGSVSMSMLSPDQVAVSSKGKLTIIDLKFGSILQKMDVDTEVTKICTIKDLILLDTPTGIEKIQYSTLPITLAAAVLKNEETRLISEVQHAEWNDSPTQVSVFNNKDADLIEVLLKTTQEINFDKSWMRFWKGRSEEFRKEFCRSNMMRQILFRFGVDDEKKKFWPQATILKIVSTGLIPGRWCDGVFSQICEKRDWDLLMKCMQEVTDIPEHTMVKCLTHLTKPDGGGPSVEKMDCESKVLPEVHSCINSVLQLPYSENHLRNELLSLPFKCVLVLLTYLTTLLEQLSLASESPTLDQAICWVSLIIDTHLSEIVMLEDTWPLVQRLQKAVELQGAIFNELTEVGELLTKIQCKIPNMGRTEPKSLYFVEIMRF